MGSTLIEKPPLAESEARRVVGDPNRIGPGSNGSRWRWMIAACLILGVSGGARFYRDHQFAALSNDLKESPFPLADFSPTLGSWRALENSDTKLDPEVARIAGSTDHILRTYVQSDSGEKIHVMVLYGLAEDVYGHTPEVCYPASGYHAATAPKDYSVAVAADSLANPIRYRTQVYFQGRGAAAGQYTEASYSFRLGSSRHGMWQPDMSRRWKSFRYQPGMFKIQMSREVSAGAANPETPKSEVNESLMVEMIREIERRLAAVGSPEA